MKSLSFVLLLLSATIVRAQETPKWQGKFEQLDQQLPTPNEYRTGSGAPGPKYWQQQADYVINVTLNDQNQTARLCRAVNASAGREGGSTPPPPAVLPAE